jgi:4-amino-4-deoxychorismate lyase
MFPFFESIRYRNGVPENLIQHQQRVNNTFNQFGANINIDLSEHIHSFDKKPALDNHLYKCRFQYDLTGKVNIEFEAYTIRKINSISFFDIGTLQYPFKFSDRGWIKEAILSAGTDEIIMTQNEFIKDASYANVVFFDGKNWITPLAPLLKGTRRASLLNDKIIMEAPLQIKDIKHFESFKLINAMMLWEESPLFGIENLV